MTPRDQSQGRNSDRDLALKLAMIPHLLMIAGFIAVGMGLTYYVLTSDNNPIAELMKILGGLSLVLSMVRPKLGLVILIAAAGYLDLVKRIAYWFGYYSAANQGVGTLQISILSFAPLTILGVFLGVIIRRIFVTKRLIESREYFAAAFILLVNVAVLKSQYTLEHDFIGAVSKGANECVYVLLIFVVPSMISTRQEILSVIRAIFVIFIPCALYGIWQGLFGYTDLDVMWMNSGITITEGLMYDVKARAFGTLASPHPYTLLNWIVIIGTYLAYDARKEGKKYFWFYLIFTQVYCLALFFGFGRSAWVSMICTGVAFYFFRTAKKAVVLYAMAVAAFVAMVQGAEYLLDHMGDFQSVMPTGSDSAEMSFRLGTFSERLFSVQNWTRDARLWSWFGRSDLADFRVLGYDEITHDMLGQILVKYGAVGLIGGAGFAAVALYFFHRSTLRIVEPKARKLATLFLAMISMNFFFGCIGGSSYQVFPWNVFIWLVVGLQIVLCRQNPPEAPPSQDPSVDTVRRGYGRNRGTRARFSLGSVAR